MDIKNKTSILQSIKVNYSNTDKHEELIKEFNSYISKIEKKEPVSFISLSKELREIILKVNSSASGALARKK